MIFLPGRTKSTFALRLPSAQAYLWRVLYAEAGLLRGGQLGQLSDADEADDLPRFVDDWKEGFRGLPHEFKGLAQSCLWIDRRKRPCDRAGRGPGRKRERSLLKFVPVRECREDASVRPRTGRPLDCFRRGWWQYPRPFNEMGRVWNRVIIACPTRRPCAASRKRAYASSCWAPRKDEDGYDGQHRPSPGGHTCDDEEHGDNLSHPGRQSRSPST